MYVNEGASAQTSCLQKDNDFQGPHLTEIKMNLTLSFVCLYSNQEDSSLDMPYFTCLIPLSLVSLPFNTSL